MSLPNLPYKPRIRSSEIVDFRGLDRTDAAPEGALHDAKNISTARWPVLSPRGKREKLTGYTGVTDMYEWDGHLFVVSGTSLLYDGDTIGTVAEGKKQWAVLNTKLVIFPDKITVDLSGETPSVKSMEADVNVGGSPAGAVLTPTSIRTPGRTVIAKNETIGYTSYPEGTGQGTYPYNVFTYTYGSDADAVTACCSSSGVWDLTALEALQQTAGTAGDFYAVDKAVEVGDIFIPSYAPGTLQQYGMCAADRNARSQYPQVPDTSQYNSNGWYCIVTGVRRTDIPGSSQYARQIQAVIYFDVVRAKPGAPDLTEYFSENDTIAVEGTPGGIDDRRAVTVRSVSETENAVYFDDNTFTAPYAYVVLNESLGASVNQYLRYNRKVYRFSSPDVIEAETTLYIMADGADKVYAFRNGEVIGEYNAYVTDEDSVSVTEYIDLSEYAANLGGLRLKRSVPDMDFICESGNRLWGVSNKDNTILASALGMPSNFATFDGVDTDSYQVAVGSEGDFTAICAYGGGVCCWKERRLHKVIGSYPSEYYTADYRIEGVAAGSDRSLTVVNETLYYNGVTGVYAYAGGSPQSIGYPLGGVLTGAAGGTDGKRWCLSGLRADGEAEMLVYDLVHRLWAREDDTLAVAFCTADGVLHFLSDGEIWQTERGDPETTMEWAAEFAQFTETVVLRKYYLRLNLRVDMAEGSTLTVKVKEDGGDWRTVCEADALRTMAKRLAILPRRCDRFRVRIEGTGNVVLRAMTREYLMGSERV